MWRIIFWPQNTNQNKRSLATIILITQNILTLTVKCLTVFNVCTYEWLNVYVHFCHFRVTNALKRTNVSRSKFFALSESASVNLWYISQPVFHVCNGESAVVTCSSQYTHKLANICTLQQLLPLVSVFPPTVAGTIGSSWSSYFSVLKTK